MKDNDGFNAIERTAHKDTRRTYLTSHPKS